MYSGFARPALAQSSMARTSSPPPRHRVSEADEKITPVGLKEALEPLCVLERLGLGAYIDYMVFFTTALEFIKEKGLMDEYEEFARKHDVKILGKITGELSDILREVARIFKIEEEVK